MGMDHYTKVRELGGTNGAFLARDRQQPDRLVVIKRLADGTQGMEELNASLRLRHPHVIRFLESFLYNGALYVVMQYEPGGDLDELFTYLKERHKTPTTHTLLLWFVQLLEALAFCHSNHVIHRDIKPSNILVSEDTKLLYLADFGSSKALGTSNVTSTFVGSPLWISPEVLMGMKYSFAADIWSLGCVFYEMATLRKPFLASSFAQLVDQVTHGQTAPLPPSVAPEVRSIIQSMLRLHPAERTTAAAALEVAKAAMAEVEPRRNVTPTPIRSPALAPNTAANASPLRTTLAVQSTPPPHSAPVALVAAAAASSSLSKQSASATGALCDSPDEDSSSVPPDAHIVSSGVPSPLADVIDTATPPGSVNGGAAEGKARAVVPGGGKSPSLITIKKKRPAGGSLSPSAPIPAKTPTPPPPAPTPPPTTATVEVPPAEEEKSVSTASAAEPCEPQQMVFNISTGAFRRPLARKRPTPARNAPATRQPAAPAHPSRQSQQHPPPQRRQVVSVPAPTTGGSAPNFVRQSTSDSAFSRRRSTTSAAEVINEQRNSLNAAEPKAAVKMAPPQALASRAKMAVEHPSSRRHAPGESPPRAVAVPPPPLINEAGRQTTPETNPPAAPPHAGRHADRVPADQWLEERMRELSAMESYLFQHRVGDNKVLQTYDARRHEEYEQLEAAEAAAAQRVCVPAPPQRSPAPRRQSPSKAFCSATHSPGVLVISPPVAHKSQQQQHQQHRQRSRRSVGSVDDSHPGSLASTFNGRQASNARGPQLISEEEHRRLEEERAAAREKREAERQRMKALIQEQRAAAKKQKSKRKKGCGNGAMEVDIVLPNRTHFAAGDATTAVE